MPILVIQSQPSKVQRIGLGVLLALMLFYAYYANDFVWQTAHWIIAIISSLVFGVVYFSKVTCQITASGIDMRFLFIRKCISLSELRYITLDQLVLTGKFFGYGYRMNFDGDIGFVFSSPYVIKIVLYSGKTYYVSFDEEYLPEVLKFLRK